MRKDNLFVEIKREIYYYNTKEKVAQWYHIWIKDIYIEYERDGAFVVSVNIWSTLLLSFLMKIHDKELPQYYIFITFVLEMPNYISITEKPNCRSMITIHIQRVVNIYSHSCGWHSLGHTLTLHLYWEMYSVLQGFGAGGSDRMFCCVWWFNMRLGRREHWLRMIVSRMHWYSQMPYNLWTMMLYLIGTDCQPTH